MRNKVPLKLFLKKIMLRNPGFGARVVKNFYDRHRAAEADYRRKDGTASIPPTQISLRITNVCNHRCDVCGQYGARGYMKSGRSEALLKTLPVERYKRLIDEVAFSKPIIYVTGGEPFLYPGLMDLVRYAKSKGLLCSIVTNGVKLKSCAEQIVKDKWDMILVSFDGPEEIHDSCRNVKGAFRAAYDGILAVQAEKRKHGSVHPYVMTSTTLSKKNVGHLHETFQIGNDLDADLMVVYLSWFTNTRIGRRQQAIFRRELDVEAYTWRSYCATFKRKDAEDFARALIDVKKKKWNFDYFIIPDVGDKNYADYYLHPDVLFGYAKCIAPFVMVDVMPNGDVTTCRDFIDVVVGNIDKDPLLKVWNSPKFVQFRKLLLKNDGTLPQCSRCCGLMGF